MNCWGQDLSTRSSPSSDQSSCGTEKLTIRGVSARCGGSSCCAALKCSDCTCAPPASSSRNASTSTYSFGSSRLRDQSNHRQPGSARVASVNDVLIEGQASASSGRTRNFAVMKIIAPPCQRPSARESLRPPITTAPAAASHGPRHGTASRPPEDGGSGAGAAQDRQFSRYPAIH